MELLSILKDVVAYVEVRSSSDNRSEAVRQKLEQLGACVEASFTDKVTHILFKEGLKRTWAKAKKRGLPLVSVSWLDSCKQNEKRMPEKDFPAILPEEVGSPLPRMNQGPRWKKMKSMQPCDFDEEIARSAERGEKRRKRVMMANRFKLSEEQTPPLSSPVPILALDTQARSPMFATLSRKSSPIPDTPPSMKERLDKMRREQRQILGEDNSSTTPRTTIEIPLQKRLFEKLGSDFMSTEDSSDDEDRTSKMVKKLIQSLDSNSESGTQSPTSKKDGESACKPRKFNGCSSVLNIPASKCHKETADKKTLRLKTTATELDLSFSLGEESLRTSRSSTNPNVENKNDQSAHENQPLDLDFSINRKNKSPRLKLHSPRSMAKALSPKDDNINTSCNPMKPSNDNQEGDFQTIRQTGKATAELIQHPQGFTTDTLEPISKSVLPKQSETSNYGGIDKELMDCNRSESKNVEPGKRRQSKRLSSSVYSKRSPALEGNLVSELSGTPSKGVEKLNPQKVDLSKLNSSKVKDSKISSFTSNIPTPLETKTSKKKRKLLSGPAFSTNLPLSLVKPLQHNSSSEVPSSIKSHGKITGANSKSDVSFLYGESETEKTRDKRKSRRLSSVKAKSSKTNDSKSSSEDTLEPGQTQKKNQISFVGEENGAQDQSKNQTSNSNLDDSFLKNNALGTSMSVLYGNTSSVANSSAVRLSSRRSIDEFSNTWRGKKKLKNASETASKIPLTEIEEGKIASSKGTPNIKIEQASHTKRVNLKADEKKKKSSLASKRVRSNSSSCEDHATQRPLKRRKDTNSVTSEDIDTTLNNSSASNEVERAPAILHHARSLVMDQSFMCIQKKRSNSLVMTSLHREEQELVYSVVKNLKAFHMTNNVESTTTHVVCGEPRRTLNLLKGIARGCWILSKEWVMESLEAGGWLSEEDYELTEVYPSAKKSRCERQNVGPGYKVDLFSKIGPVFVANNAIPPRKELVHFINLCSGHVTGSELRAAVHVGNEHDPQKLVISPTWILDSIIKLECLPTDDYIVPGPISFTQRESSPEF